MTIKEFEIQKALGLAEEYFLTITTTNITPKICVQTIKDAVEKHTFVSKCIAKEIKYLYTTPIISGDYKVIYTSAGPTRITLTFCVKCIHEVENLIITELQYTSHEINTELRLCPGLLDMDPIPVIIQQNFTANS